MEFESMSKAEIFAQHLMQIKACQTASACGHKLTNAPIIRALRWHHQSGDWCVITDDTQDIVTAPRE
jgi:hypothetical protein